MTILSEADALIHNDRQEQYGHPLDTYTKTAELVNALLAEKLRQRLTAEDIVKILALMKFARYEMNPSRDSLVDLAGYTGCLKMIEDERKRRG